MTRATTVRTALFVLSLTSIAGCALVAGLESHERLTSPDAAADGPTEDVANLDGERSDALHPPSDASDASDVRVDADADATTGAAVVTEVVANTTSYWGFGVTKGYVYFTSMGANPRYPGDPNAPQQVPRLARANAQTLAVELLGAVQKSVENGSVAPYLHTSASAVWILGSDYSTRIYKAGILPGGVTGITEFGLMGLTMEPFESSEGLNEFAFTGFKNGLQCVYYFSGALNQLTSYACPSAIGGVTFEAGTMFWGAAGGDVFKGTPASQPASAATSFKVSTGDAPILRAYGGDLYIGATGKLWQYHQNGAFVAELASFTPASSTVARLTVDTGGAYWIDATQNRVMAWRRTTKDVIEVYRAASGTVRHVAIDDTDPAYLYFAVETPADGGARRYATIYRTPK